MSEPITVRVTLSPPDARARTEPSLAGSSIIVLAFWWIATGVTFAMQRGPRVSAAILLAASLAACAGAAIIHRSRDDDTPRGARTAFLGAALVWWWTAALFYSGWGVDLSASISAPPRSMSLALAAIVATLRPDLFALAALVVIGALVVRRRNTVALGAFAVFWLTLQTAKLNVFFGVRNAGVDLLPTRLAGLGAFFGPPHNSPLLLATNLALVIGLVVLLSRAYRARRPFARHSATLLGTLVALALLEHVLLGVDFRAPLWDAFLGRST